MSKYVHKDNILQKENHQKKYIDEISQRYLKEIRQRYNLYKQENIDLIGPKIEICSKDIEIVKKRVDLFNNYKNFLDQQQYAEKFDSRSNLHSSALEEFIYFLFRDLVADCSNNALIGKSHTFKDIFFRSNNYMELLSNPTILIETKDHDFVIGTQINFSFNCKGSSNIKNATIELPAVAIECKTYLDKTMLEGASTSAEQLKLKSQNALYIVVCERLKLTESINLKKIKVDQIYILRKQKNTDREDRYSDEYVDNPIYYDVVFNLFNLVRKHLSTNWHSSIAEGIERGYLI